MAAEPGAEKPAEPGAEESAEPGAREPAEPGARKRGYERFAEGLAASRPGAWFYVHIAPPIDRVLMRLTRGRLTTGGMRRVGMLKVKGAKTGIERQTPLVYTRDGDNVLLVASRGGDAKHPAWYRNVVANPDVSFTIRGEERLYRGRTAQSEERPRLWKLVVRRYGGYLTYQQRAGDREIPVVVLEPRG
jgi:deazaflavin-dependent oxidoreductase (nitroreductase family)